MGVYKRSADRSASIRGGHYVPVSCAYAVTIALRSQNVPIGYHVQHSTSLAVGWHEKKTIKPKEQVCIGIIRNCWPFVHLKWLKQMRGLHKLTNNNNLNKQKIHIFDKDK